MSSNTNAIGFGMNNRFALYVEGELCPFDQIDRHREVGGVPTLVVSLPPTEALRRIKKRARVHLLYRDHNDRWVGLMEAELLARGFRKSDSNRTFQLICNHVTGLFDQFAINTVDPASMPEVMMTMRNPDGNTNFTEATAAALKGSLLTLLRPDEVKHELEVNGYKRDHVNPTRNDGELTFGEWVSGAFQRYLRVIRSSKIANSYLYRAIVFHKLGDRMLIPRQDVVRWDKFLDHILAEMFLASGERVGDRQTFWELVRGLAQNFLYELNVEPSARTFASQVQVKPIAIFNAIPKCNVLYPSLIENYSFEEDPAQKPTRTETHFQWLNSFSNAAQAGPIFRKLTVFAPAELQWKWQFLRDKNGGKLVEGTIDTNKALAKIVPPEPQFLTREEEERGIVANYFDVPSLLNQALMHMSEEASEGDFKGSSVSITSDTSDADRRALASSALDGKDENSRRIRYQTLMTLALGASGGLNGGLKINNQPLKGKYRPLNKKGGIFTFSGTTYNEQQAVTPQMVPQRVVFISTLQRAVWKNDSTLTNLRELVHLTGANYHIDRNGTIIQLRSRNHITWAEPKAIPMGLKTTFNDKEASDINDRMPHVGGDRTAKKGAIPTITGKFKLVNPAAGPTQSIVWTRELDLGAAGVTIDTQDALDVTLAKLSTPSVAKLVNAKVTVPRLIPGDDKVYADLAFTVAKGSNGKPKLVFDHSTFIPIFGPAEAGKHEEGTFTLSGSTSFGLPYQPYWLIPKTTPAPKLTSNVTEALNEWDAGMLDDRFKKKDPLFIHLDASHRSFTAGNFNSVVIAFEQDKPGASPTKAQLEAAAYLAASITEISVVEDEFEKNGKPRRLNASGSGFTGRLLREIEPIQSYLGANCFGFVNGFPGNFLGLVDEYRERFYADFEAVSKALEAGTFAGKIALEAATDDSTSVPASDAKTDTLETGSAATAAGEDTAGTEAAAETTEQKVKNLTNMIRRYAAPLVNFMHFYARYAPQQTEIPGVFNPYALVGYPCLLPDDTPSRMHLAGYVHSIHDTISGSGSATTSYSITHLRPIDEEGHLPYDHLEPQAYPIRELLDSSYKGKLKAELDRLKKSGLVTTKKKEKLPGVYAHLPVDFHGIGIQPDEKNPVPFVYDAGFGLAETKADRPAIDFSEYARFTGLGDGTGKDWKKWLIFQGQNVDGYVNKPANEAFAAIYRPIQEVGNSGDRASLIEFDGVTGHPSKPPKRIKVKIENAKTLKDDYMAFEPSIQEAIVEHRGIVEKRLGTRG